MTPSEITNPVAAIQPSPDDTSCEVDLPTVIVCQDLHRIQALGLEGMVGDSQDNQDFADGSSLFRDSMRRRKFTREELDRELAMYETGALHIHGVNLGEGRGGRRHNGGHRFTAGGDRGTHTCQAATTQS